MSGTIFVNGTPIGTLTAFDLEASPDRIMVSTGGGFTPQHLFAAESFFTALDRITPFVELVDNNSHDVRREAKRLGQAEAKLARARQIKANGGRR